MRRLKGPKNRQSTDKVFLGVIFSRCVIYTKTIIHLSFGESDA